MEGFNQMIMRKRKAKTKNKTVSIYQRQRSQRKKRQKRKYPTRKKLVVLLGAGFSVLAELPIAKVLNATFNRNIKDKLLRFSSSEWEWIDTVTYDITHKDLNIQFYDKPEWHISNGKNNYDCLAYSYIINELVLKYKEINTTLDNYEDLFQFALDLKEDHVLANEIYSAAKSQLLNDYDNIEDYYLTPFLAINYQILIDIFSYLIADLLHHNLSANELSFLYKPFIDYINKFEEVEIFTLNHDTILETIFEYKNIAFTKGFKRKASEIGHDNKRLPVFNSKKIGTHKLQLLKLHGSINTYGFKHAYKVDNMHYLTNKTSYFIGDYDERHHAYRVDKKSGERVQELNFDIVPKFITGERKSEIIKNDLMYSFLYNRYNNAIKNAQDIFISGYSFCDEHINKELEKSKCKLVINQNPGIDYPYPHKHQQINYLEDLSTI